MANEAVHGKSIIGSVVDCLKPASCPADRTVTGGSPVWRPFRPGGPLTCDAFRAVRQAGTELRGVDEPGGDGPLTAWRYPAGYGWTPVGSELDFEGDAKRALTEALGEVSGLDPEVPVRPLVAEGNSAEVLLRTAKGADLLVMGSRGHGGLASALIGSVSLNCVLHAHCPVLVVRDGRDAAGPA